MMGNHNFQHPHVPRRKKKLTNRQADNIADDSEILTDESNTSLNLSIRSSKYTNLSKTMNESSSFVSISEDQNSVNNVKTHRLNDDNSLMEEFLENSRYGNIEKVVEIVEQKSLEVKNFKINYRGIHKRFYGWTALHLSCYFNQIEVVRYLLKQPDIDINITNNENDTPLHKAVHSSINSSRYNIVELLLLNNADITLKNNQGLRPIDLASDPSVKSLIEAAEKTENYNLQKQFFEAVIENDLDLINKLLVNKNFDLNCTDTFGNTALHIASNKNRCEIAILLIEKGISTIVQNQQKLTALDLAKTKEMKEIIGYVPYNHRKYQGFLLKKRKFLGYKEYFVVLNKGYIIYYSNEIDAAKDHNRKGTYFLNNAIIREYADNGQEDYLAYSWTILYTNGKKHTLCSLLSYKRKNNGTSEHAGFRSHIKEKTRSLVTAKRTQLKPIERKKKWIDAIKEHIKYSDSHLGASTNNETQAMPIESLHKYLNHQFSLKISFFFFNNNYKSLNSVPG
ncbi:unnamed protein product [Brachionus calyciflorus]|uniref:PH domain-containing protein n=1 Tax=Brachionus calyciflorus TaxID=104777 RepID=A0A813M7U2_9BILA|nr:unnamed protein product [Brachionus calyciflorus]